ncbi:MAG: hypothetical protein ILP16_00990 [Spirochaetales bacterium]|nr:hypothetical protein [Spirochaetales bacterium]
MSKGYVNNKILDGALGAMPAEATGIFGAVGVASIPTDGIIILTDPSDANEKLGGGPLRDLVVQALSMAKTTVYAVGLPGSTAGTIGAVTKTGTGAGSLTVSGSPRNEYKVKVTIQESGVLNAAVAVVDVDGVPTKAFTVPAGGTYALANTGLTLTFAANETGFVAGDVYEFETTAPVASNAEILAAIDELLDSKYDYEWISIAGVSDKTLWAALATKAEAAEAVYRYIHFKAQARYLVANETVDQYVAALVGSERGTVVGGRVQVSAAWCINSDPFGEVDRRPGSGHCAGMSAQKDVSEPVDHVGSSAISGIVELLPPGLNDGHINALDNAGYETFCQYIGRTGVYITHGRMFAESTSDYQLEERRRVMDLACKNVRTAQLNYINSTVALDAEGNMIGLDMFTAVTEQVLKNMKDAGRISDYEFSIDAGQDILSTEKLTTRIRIIPLGKMTFIENVISYMNPNLAS